MLINSCVPIFWWKSFSMIFDKICLKGTKCFMKLLLQLVTSKTEEKQEAHGTHRSPEKTVQINKYIWLYNNINKEKEKKHY